MPSTPDHSDHLKPTGEAGAEPRAGSQTQTQTKATPPERPAPRAHRARGRFRRLPRWKKALILGAALILGVTAAGAGAAWGLVHRYESQVKHKDLLGDAAIPKQQQEQHFKNGPINLLLLGSDSRDGEANPQNVTGERSDTIMMVHVSADRTKAAFVSIPRDSYVDIPAGGTWKGGKNKINAALAFGGTALAAKTITQLTGVQFDGAMLADFAGIRNMVDAVGGVNVCLDRTVKSSFSSKVWAQGCHDMGGAEAEEFMRQRKNLPDGDFGRMQDQQLVVKSIIQKISSNGLLTNPFQLDKLIMTAARTLTIDKTLDLQQLALAVKSVPYGAVQFAQVPHSNPDLKTAAGSSVELDAQKSAAMFAAIRSDTIDQWIASNPASTQAGSGG